MTYRLFIDDERFPADATGHWGIARNEAEIAALLRTHGAPEFVSFDHDLGDGEPTGYDIAHRFVDDDLGDLPDSPYAIGIPATFGFDVHSQNPVGAANIRNLLTNYLKFRREKQGKTA